VKVDRDEWSDCESFSNVIQRLNRHFVLDVAGVQCRRRFKQQNVNLFFGNRAMLDAMRDDQEFTLLDPHVTVAKFHAEPAFHYQEQFILDIVMVPDERASEFDQLYLLTVEFPDHSRLEMVREKRELFQQVDLVHAHSLTRLGLAVSG
jgi:hypothetical protein